MGNDVFDPKIHICKFGYEFYSDNISEERYGIFGDMYLKEIRIDFYKPQTDGGKTVTDTVGFELSDEQVSDMLPLLEVGQFEKYRDLPSGWELDPKYGGNGGYRDGWGYTFWYMSEYGTPLFQTDMAMLFSNKKLPPYEKLLSRLRDNFKENKKLKNKKILW